MRFLRLVVVNRYHTPKADLDALCDEFLAACRSGAQDTIGEKLSTLRKAVLFQGIDEDTDEDIHQAATTVSALPMQPTWIGHTHDMTQGHGLSRVTQRGKLWKALIGLEKVDAAEYIKLVKKVSSLSARCKPTSFMCFLLRDSQAATTRYAPTVFAHFQTRRLFAIASQRQRSSASVIPLCTSMVRGALYTIS